MANSLNPIDVYQIINEVVAQATGRQDLRVVDLTSFQSVGETLLRTGYENTLNAISIVLSRTIFSIRPYVGRLRSLMRNESAYGGHVRKLTPLYQAAEPSQDWNTQLSPQQLANGNSIDMYKISAPSWVQFNFYGMKTLQKRITRFDYQLEAAFESPQQMDTFWRTAMLEYSNEITLAEDAERQALLIGAVTGIMAMGGANVIDLVSAYNNTHGTSYTREQLLTTYIDDFMPYVAGEIQVVSSRLTDMSVNYHANITTYNDSPVQGINRHTPRQNQRMIMYTPAFTRMRARVFPTLFNPQYLNIGVFEGVNYWQSQSDPMSMEATPVILNTVSGEAVKGSQTSIDYVLGILFDEEFIGALSKFRRSSVTPYNSAGSYYNIFTHWLFNNYTDYTENAVIFILGSGGVAAQPVTNISNDASTTSVDTSKSNEINYDDKTTNDDVNTSQIDSPSATENSVKYEKPKEITEEDAVKSQGNKKVKK